MPTRLTFEILIDQAPERVFELMADLRGYDAWLPRSIVFKGTTSVSPGPVRCGTTYVEASPWGTRRGVVTNFAPPGRLSFHQPMTLRPEFLGSIEIGIDQLLTAAGEGTRFHREVRLAFEGPVRFLAGPVAASFRRENDRMLRHLKAEAERAGSR